MIVDYLRNEMKIRTIGVHGESLGGIVATHLGNKKRLDFLCADRTFSSLALVGKYSIGKKINYFFQIMTNWNKNITRDYLNASCYKVLLYEPKDEMIPYLSSFKEGVLTEILHRKYGISEQAKSDLNENVLN